ncbi:MAG: SpoIID/LytB domain-containing protein [Acidimicrobiales bacterium]
MALASAASVVGLSLGAAPAAAYPTSTVQITGHGWGGGDGMGQWGALGYAIGQDGGAGNTTYQNILAHFYGGTTLGPDTADPSDAESIRVAITENAGQSTIVYDPGGANLVVPGVVTGAQALYFAQDGSGWDVYAGADCAGGTDLNPPQNWTRVATGVANPQASDAGGGPIQLCEVGGNLAVDGSLGPVDNSAGAERTVNTLPLAQYLDGVVPSESPSSWGGLGGAGPQGEPWGFQELEAQAVAARSYVLAYKASGGYFGYADICDSTACQAYTGLADQANPYTAQAVADTAGQVMLTGSGAIAETTYASSTGGYTSGPNFTPVPDAGDSVCVPGACNPNHSWTVQVPVSSVEAQWPTVGTLQSIDVIQRNGLGDFGGRALSVVVAGNTGSVTVSGDTFAADLGLKSDWFAIEGQPSGGVAGYWLSAADGGVFSFGDAQFHGSMGGQPLNQPMVGMASTADHAGYWQVAADGGVFSFGDAQFHGSMGGKPLNQPIVGMAPTPDGGGYWLVAADGGIFAFGDAGFYGSMGGKPLNRPVVGMAPTPDGKGYWLVASDGGIFAFGDAQFHGSTGSLSLVRPVVGMAPTPDGGGYWLVAADGGIFAFGDAGFYGSGAGTSAGSGAVAIAGTATGDGYLIVNGAGQVSSFGDAPQLGDLTTAVPNYPGHVVALATTP